MFFSHWRSAAFDTSHFPPVDRRDLGPFSSQTVTQDKDVFLSQSLTAAPDQTRQAELLKTTPLNTPLYFSFLCLSIVVVT